MQCYKVYFIWELLYMFRMVPSPIIRSANNCIYSIWYLPYCYCYLLLLWRSWNWFLVCCGWRTYAIDTVVCAPDDGWWYHPKNVEQFPDKINCVTLHLVGYILEYWYTCLNAKSKFISCENYWTVYLAGRKNINLTEGMEKMLQCLNCHTGPKPLYNRMYPTHCWYEREVLGNGMGLSSRETYSYHWLHPVHT